MFRALISFQRCLGRNNSPTKLSSKTTDISGAIISPLDCYKQMAHILLLSEACYHNFRTDFSHFTVKLPST